MGVVEEYSNSGGTVGDPVTISPPVGNPVATKCSFVIILAEFFIIILMNALCFLDTRRLMENCHVHSVLPKQQNNLRKK